MRVAYAAALATLASTSARFLQRAFATEDKAWDQKRDIHESDANDSNGRHASGAAMSAGEYEADLAAIRAIVRGVAMDYLTPDGAPPAPAREGGGGLSQASRQVSLTTGALPLRVERFAPQSDAPIGGGHVGIHVSGNASVGDGTGDAPIGGGHVAGVHVAGGNGASTRGAIPASSRPTFFARASIPSSAPPSATAPSVPSPQRTAVGRMDTVPGAQGVGPATRAALLSGAEELARFFGRADSNDFLVPLLITCLNDRAWPLRASFFRHIARVGKFVGSAPCEAFLLPCVERCLSDSSDEVVAWALKCLAEMVGGAPPEEHEAHGATNGLAFNNKENETNDETNDETSDGAIKASPNERVGSVLRKRSVVAAARRAAPALCHPASAVRASARRFFAAAARFLGRADTFALLLPSVRPFLRDEGVTAVSGGVQLADVVADEDGLRAALKPPPSRAAFDAAVATAAGVSTPRERSSSTEDEPEEEDGRRGARRSSASASIAFGSDSESIRNEEDAAGRKESARSYPTRRRPRRSPRSSRTFGPSPPGWRFEARPGSPSGGPSSPGVSRRSRRLRSSPTPQDWETVRGFFVHPVVDDFDFHVRDVLAEPAARGEGPRGAGRVPEPAGRNAEPFRSRTPERASRPGARRRSLADADAVRRRGRDGARGGAPARRFRRVGGVVRRAVPAAGPARRGASSPAGGTPVCEVRVVGIGGGGEL